MPHFRSKGMNRVQWLQHLHRYGDTCPTPLTEAWVAETGETDQTIIDALEGLEIGLCQNELTDKIIALYPMVGGTAAKHKYNFQGILTKRIGLHSLEVGLMTQMELCQMQQMRMRILI